MNWGKKLVTGLALFMIFMVTLGTIMIMRSGEDALIESDYYEKGQRYNEQYQAKQNALNDMTVPVLLTDQNGVTITFPLPVKYRLTCKRLSDQDMDKIFEGSTEAEQIIELLKGDLPAGPWMLKIEYSANNKDYLFEGEIMMP